MNKYIVDIKDGTMQVIEGIQSFKITLDGIANMTLQWVLVMLRSKSTCELHR